MKHVSLNSTAYETAAESVAELLAERQIGVQGIAVAVNNKIVSKADWDKTAVNENDNIVIIKAACGG